MLTLLAKGQHTGNHWFRPESTNYGSWKIQPITSVVSKVKLEHNHAHSFTHGCFSVTMAELRSCSSAGVWPAKLKIFTTWPLIEKVRQPLKQNIIIKAKLAQYKHSAIDLQLSYYVWILVSKFITFQIPPFSIWVKFINPRQFKITFFPLCLLNRVRVHQMLDHLR